MILEYNEFSRTGTLYMSSTVISDQQEKEVKEQAKEGARTGF